MTEEEKVAYLKDRKKARRAICAWLGLPRGIVEEVSAIRYESRNFKDCVDFSIWLRSKEYVMYTSRFDDLVDEFFIH